MVCYKEFCAQVAHMESAMSALGTEWTNHMTITKARLSNSPKKPFLNDSKTVTEALSYLQSEVNSINSRFQGLVRWKLIPGDVQSSFNLQDLVNDHAVKPIGTESYAWTLKRTLSKIEIFLMIHVYDLLNRAEDFVTKAIDSYKGFMSNERYFAESPRLVGFFRTYEAAERQHLLEDVGDTLADAVAKIQDESDWHEREPTQEGSEWYEIEPRLLVTVISCQWNDHLRVAERLARLDMDVPRQRLITEFF